VRADEIDSVLQAERPIYQLAMSLLSEDFTSFRNRVVLVGA
jgi:hypothetical protein